MTARWIWIAVSVLGVLVIGVQATW